MDINSIEFLERPQDFIGPLMAKGNIHFVDTLPLPGYVITGHAAVLDALVDPRLSRNVKYWEYYDPNSSIQYPTLDWSTQKSPLLNDDTHDSHRRLFQQAFKPSTIRRMEEQIIAVVSKYTHVFDGAEADGVGAFESTTLEAIATILGLAEGELDQEFLRNAQAFLGNADPLISPERKQAAEEGGAFLVKRVRELVRRFLAQPGENLLSDLVAVTRTDASISEDDIVLSVLGLFAAGSHTTAQMSAMMLKIFAAHPEQLQKLREHPELIDNAINECLRLEIVGKFIMRFVREPFALDGVTVPKGQMLMISIGAANRDPAVFAQPDEFNIERTNLGQIATFGHGMYYCTGAHIAKTVLRVELQALLDKTCGPVVQTAPAEWRRDDMVFRTLTRLPLRFGH